jgi:hypothetical protein
MKHEKDVHPVELLIQTSCPRTPPPVHTGEPVTMTQSTLSTAVRDYWDSHTLGKQYVRDRTLKPGTPEFFAHIRP